MKTKQHKIIDLPGITNKQAFWLTKVYQKYNHHYSQYIHEESLIEPYAKMTFEDNRAILGGNYKAKIKEIKDKGFVKEIPLGSYYDKTILGYIPQISNISFTKKFVRGAEKYYDIHSKRLSPLVRSIIKSYKDITVDISKQQFTKEILNRYHGKYCLKKSFQKNNNKIKTKKLSENEYYENQAHIFGTIQLINNNTYDHYSNAHECLFGNRFHTVFSSLPSSFRTNILIDGEETYEIDLNQSQPNFLGKIFFDRIGENKFSTFVKSGQDLYEYLQKYFSFPDRGISKELFFKMIYGKINTVNKSPIFSIFDDIEPIVNEIKSIPIESNPNSRINKKKYRNSAKKNQHNQNRDYTNLSYLAQQEESKVFRMIWEELLLCKITFIPIHDSVIVKKSDLEETIKIMKKIFIGQLHDNVSISIKDKNGKEKIQLKSWSPVVIF